MLDLRVPLVLASASPRRGALLSALGIPFHVRPAGVDEHWPPGAGVDVAVEAIADEKAAAVAGSLPGHLADALVLGADTVVVLDGDVLGKPASRDEAAAMLRRLSGVTHRVFTGISLRHPASGAAETAHEVTRVTFGELSDAEIDRYVATGSPLDKAGAYGIQDDHGALFVERIEGDYYNVVGLPLRLLYRTITQHFAALFVARDGKHSHRGPFDGGSSESQTR
jgi:septum formation protein